MSNIKIAVPTNDKTNIAERTGRAIGFMIFDIENKAINASAYRENPHKHDDENHSHGEHTHNDVVSVLEDCQFMIVVKVGDRKSVV